MFAKSGSTRREEHSSSTVLFVLCSGSTGSSPSAKPGSGLAAAAHMARQKSNDNAIQITPSTSNVVAIFEWLSIGRTISNIAAGASNSQKLFERAKSLSKIFTPSAQGRTGPNLQIPGGLRVRSKSHSPVLKPQILVCND